MKQSDICHPSIEIMNYCINIAKSGLKEGQYALASVVVDKNGEIISENSSRLNTGYDPTAHPEIVAIRQAAEIMKSRYLPGCFLYSTLEPCPMCTSAVIWAKMSGIVFGSYQVDAVNFAKNHPSNIFSWRQINISALQIAKQGTPTIKIHGGILREECNDLFSICFE